jgi:hypothetical protein
MYVKSIPNILNVSLLYNIMINMKRKKALSNAVSALILVIASVILTLVIVGYVFGLVGAFASLPQVEQIGVGSIGNDDIATFMLRSSGDVQIVSIQLAGTNNYAVSITPQTLTAGVNTVTASFKNVNIMPGETYTLVVVLSSGEEVLVSVIAV